MRLFCLSLTLCLVVLPQAQAQGWIVYDSDEEADLEAQFEEMGWRSGTVDLAGVATLTVPPGYRYASPEALIGDMGLSGTRGMRPVLGEGMLFAVPEPGWASAPDDGRLAGSILITHVARGHVVDDYGQTVDADEWLELRQERAEEKRDRGHRHSTVTRWLREPRYDASRRMLSWSEEVQHEDDPPAAQHEVRLLGRTSVIRISGMSDSISDESTPEEAARIQGELHAIARAIRFEPGHRYWEYDWQVDRDAEGGLAELVVGFDTYAKAAGFEPVEPPSGFPIEFYALLAAGFAVIAIVFTSKRFTA